MPTDSEIAAFLNRPENFLYALDWRKGLCEFVPAARGALAELPFLDNRTLGQSRKKGTLPFERARAAVRADGFANRGGVCDFIFHTSFCASTLLARLIDRPGKVLALKEPFALLGLSGLRRAGRADFAEWAEVCIALLSRPFGPGERTMVKPSNGANNLLPFLAGHKRAGKILLLYSPLESFLVAVVSGGPARQQFVDALFEHSLGDIGRDTAVPKTLAPLERAALAWGLQMRWFEAAARASGPSALKTLDGEKLLAAPKAALEKLNAHFGYGLTALDIVNAVDGPAFTRYAKDPSRSFDAAAAKVERTALRSRYAKEIEAALALAQRQGFMFPEGLPHPLL